MRINRRIKSFTFGEFWVIIGEIKEHHMIKFIDEWHGFSLNIPENWRCETLGEIVQVFRPEETDPAVMIWPMKLPQPTDMATLCRDILQAISKDDPSFHAAEKPAASGGGNENEKLIEFGRRIGTLIMRGMLKVRLLDETTAEVTGIQAPAREFVNCSDLLWEITAGYEKIGRLEREEFREPSEKAFSFQYPRGWLANGTVLRLNPPSGPITIRWIAEDPETRAKAFNDGAVLDFVFYPWGGMANPLAQAMFMNPQTAWKVRPFMNMKECTETVIFQLVRQMRPDLRLEKVVIDPRLEKYCRETYKPGADALGKQLEISAGYVISTYTENGVHFKECGIICNWMMLDQPNPMAMMTGGGAGQYWFSTIGPIFRAPVEVFEAKSPVLKGIIASYKVNQQWDQGQVQTIKKKIDQDQFNAEQQRAAMFSQTQGYVTRTAQEIAAGRRATTEYISMINSFTG